MIRHTENVRSVGSAELEMGDDFHWVTVPITTAGGVQKLLKLSESEASLLAAHLADALSLRPAETRAATFNASIRANTTR